MEYKKAKLVKTESRVLLTGGWEVGERGRCCVRVQTHKLVGK